MLHSRPKFRISVVLWTVVLLVLAAVALIVPPRGGSKRGPTKARVKIDILNYTASLIAYSNIYSSLPRGDNATVTAILMGKNPDKHILLNVGSLRLNERGEFLDPKGRPYDINVTTNAIHITSRSK